MTRPSAARDFTTVLAFALALAGCSMRDIHLARDFAPDEKPENGSGEPIPGLSALQITPSSDETTFDGDSLDPIPKFHALGTLRTGVRDVTEDVEWTLSRPEFGSIAGGQLRSAAFGGRVQVRVRAGDLSATAELLVRLDIAVRPTDVDESVVRAFERAKDREDSSSLELVYPPADAVVPANFENLRMQWHAPDSLDQFEVRIESDYARLRYYTTGARDWLDGAKTSRHLAPSHPGEVVKIRVSGRSSKDTDRVVQSAPISLQVAESSLLGPVYYASTTARGLKRSELSAASALRVLPAASEQDSAACASCHAISRTGDRVAVSTKDQKLAVYTLPDLTPLAWLPPAPPAMPPPPAMMPAAPAMPTPGMPAPDKGMMMPAAMPPMAAMPPKPPPQEYGWGTFNPDGTRLAYTARGKLHVIDTQTGAEAKKVMLPKDVSVTHPDWSPDGRWIAVTYTQMKPSKSDKLVRGSDIALMRVLEDGSIEEPQVRVKSLGADDTLVYPAFSPDSRFIAFARATGSSKDSSSVQLYVVPADGSATAVALDRSGGSSASSMPTWAPASESGPAFLAFSSTRDYGDVLAGAQRDQLWLTALDLAALERGEDPSFPAVWLPFQDASESNHRAIWSTAACAPRSEVCDERDDDCDGTIDESCCTPQLEVCNDGDDNDCDGVRDEGCNCSEKELCDDGVDNDCDTNVDEDCKE